MQADLADFQALTPCVRGEVWTLHSTLVAGPSPWELSWGSHASSFHSAHWPTNEGTALEQTQAVQAYSLESKHRIKASVCKGVWRECRTALLGQLTPEQHGSKLHRSIYTWPFFSNKYYSTTWVVVVWSKGYGIGNTQQHTQGLIINYICIRNCTQGGHP